MPGKHQIGGGFPLAGVGVKIAADQTGGLPGDQRATVDVFPHGLIAGREIQDQRGTGLGQSDRRRLGSPQVFTQLYSDGETGQRLAGEEHVGAEDRLLGAEGEEPVCGPSGGEPSLFVEFAVVGQMGLGDHAQNLTLVDDRRTVVELVVPADRQPDGSDHIQAPGGLQHRGEGLLGAVQKGVLEEQVPAGIAGEAQLREAQHPHTLAVGLPHEGKAALGVVTAVGHPDGGRAGGDLDKTIAHEKDLLCVADIVPQNGSLCNKRERKRGGASKSFPSFTFDGLDKRAGIRYNSTVQKGVVASSSINITVRSGPGGGRRFR